VIGNTGDIAWNQWITVSKTERGVGLQVTNEVTIVIRRHCMENIKGSL